MKNLIEIKKDFQVSEWKNKIKDQFIPSVITGTIRSCRKKSRRSHLRIFRMWK